LRVPIVSYMNAVYLNAQWHSNGWMTWKVCANVLDMDSVMNPIFIWLIRSIYSGWNLLYSSKIVRRYSLHYWSEGKDGVYLLELTYNRCGMILSDSIFHYNALPSLLIKYIFFLNSLCVTSKIIIMYLSLLRSSTHFW
jgi:hypothetical protein